MVIKVTGYREREDMLVLKLRGGGMGNNGSVVIRECIELVHSIAAGMIIITCACMSTTSNGLLACQGAWPIASTLAQAATYLNY